MQAETKKLITTESITESSSRYENLEEMSVTELLENINREDSTVHTAVQSIIPQIEKLVEGIITCNPNTKLAKEVEVPLEALVGPEFVTGSTRMKAGTAQKLILNMITTSTMIKLGRVKGNKMVDMQLTNQKLVERGTRMIGDELGLDLEESRRLLLLHGSVRNVLNNYGQ